MTARVRERLREQRGVRVSLRSSTWFYRGRRGAGRHFPAGDGRDTAEKEELVLGTNHLTKYHSALEGDRDED
jgi:hypothetical protein